MKKQIILLLLLLPTVMADKLDCKGIINPSDVPCQIIASYTYENACNTYTIKFYNSSAKLIGQTAMDDWGDTDRCNASFNFSTVGYYIWNTTPLADSGRITVEVDETVTIAIAFIFGLLGVVFWVIGFYLLFKRPEADLND